MGLFAEKKLCSICGKEKTKTKVKDGYVCSKCFNECDELFNKELSTVDEVKKFIEKGKKNNYYRKNFIATKVCYGIKFDDKNKKILLEKDLLVKPRIFDYKDLLEYEVLEDGETIVQGGLGRAVVGGLLLGPVGAIVGGITGDKKSKKVIKSLKVKLVFDQLYNGIEYVTFINSETKPDSFSYKTTMFILNELLSQLLKIKNENEKKIEIKYSIADEILKFKKLYDEGIITEEEFANKKNELLAK